MLEAIEFVINLFQETAPWFWQLKEKIDQMMEVPLFKWTGIIGTAATIICAIIYFAKHGRIKV